VKYLLNPIRTLLQRAFFCGMLCGFSAFAVAQTSDFKPYFSFGTAHGISMSSINFYPTVAQKSLKGYYGGIAVAYISEKHFGLQAELNYSQRGWSEQSGSDNMQRRINYFELPIMTHVYFGNHFRWMINLGPKIGYYLSESKSTNMASPPTEYTLAIANKLDYGICAGSGFEVNTGAMSYVLEARYSYSLSDIFPNTKSDTFGSSGNQFLSVTLGVFLHFRPQHHR